METRIQAIQGVANRVAAFVLSHFRSKKFDVATKEDGSKVTNIDIEAQQIAKEMLLANFHDDGFLGEEDEEQAGNSGYRWVVDPIDGTISFIHGVPLFGTQIGLEYNGDPIAGTIVMPAIGESIHGIVGKGAWHTSASATRRPATVSSTSSIEQALVCTTSVDYFAQTNTMCLFQELTRSGCSIRGWSDCFAFMLLCTGRIDAVVEPLLHPWDINPWLPIIAESGGVFSPIGNGGIASTTAVHTPLYDALHATVAH